MMLKRRSTENSIEVWTSLGLIESSPKRRSTEDSTEDSLSLSHHWDSSSHHRNVDRLRSGDHWDSSSPHQNLSSGLVKSPPKLRLTEDSTEVFVIIGTRRVPTETSIYRGLKRGLGHHWDSSRLNLSLGIIRTHRVLTETSIYQELKRGLGHHWDSS
ncbi:2370_t:CDS:2, partial [Racocetra fulgida]